MDDEIKYSDIKATSYEISLAKLTGKQVVDVRGYLTQQYGHSLFKITDLVFEDGTTLGVGGEHDCPYLKNPYPDESLANLDEETLDRLYDELMDQYCNQCDQQTATVHNDFMVAFCKKCNAMRGNKSDYTGQYQPFTCVHCGRSVTESYVGQQVCLLCQIVNGIEDMSDGLGTD